jgi:hypothetical protein
MGAEICDVTPAVLTIDRLSAQPPPSVRNRPTPRPIDVAGVTPSSETDNVPAVPTVNDFDEVPCTESELMKTSFFVDADGVVVEMS